LIEESAGLDDADVNELVGLSKAAATEGTSSRSEAKELLHSARTATEQSKVEEQSHDVSDEAIAALLKQLEADNGGQDDGIKDSERSTDPQETKTNDPEESKQADESDDIAAILAQLTDEAHLEQKYETTSTSNDEDSPFPSVSGLSLPSVPTSTTDDFSTRLANLKSFQPKTYTGTDRGSINVFIPGIASTEEDETIHWCGRPYSSGNS
jgi:hypothetical protein